MFEEQTMQIKDMNNPTQWSRDYMPSAWAADFWQRDTKCQFWSDLWRRIWL